ncbi:MAG: hypothetical protein LBB21_02765 [Holosporaceae bacterium]|jgi:hypothetical protein|nr:hypothetical protein [Holosporaceae bacterium]
MLASCLSSGKFGNFTRNLGNVANRLHVELELWEGARVDFPGDAPYYNGVNKFQKFGECTKFKIPSGGYILFPIHGMQLSTKEVRFLSNADVEPGNPCSSIVDAYCALLGLSSGISSINVNQCLGFLPNGKSARIITLGDNNTSKQKLIDLESVVRGVLSMPEGKIWAHRMLNEIRRYHMGIGVPEFRDFNIPSRNSNRSFVLSLVEKAGEGSYLRLSDQSKQAAIKSDQSKQAAIKIDFSVLMDMPCIYQGDGKNNLVNRLKNSPYHDKYVMRGFYHEGIHLYNFLRAPTRFANEINAFFYCLEEKGMVALHSVHCWKESSGDAQREEISSRPWKPRDTLNLQEMKTVLGSKEGVQFYGDKRIPSVFSLFLNGDDMSENAIRRRFKLPIRGAYVMGWEPFFEDAAVVGKILESAGASDEDLLKNTKEVSFKYYTKGLGNSMFDLAE